PHHLLEGQLTHRSRCFRRCASAVGDSSGARHGCNPAGHDVVRERVGAFHRRRVTGLRATRRQRSALVATRRNVAPNGGWPRGGTSTAGALASSMQTGPSSLTGSIATAIRSGDLSHV